MENLATTRDSVAKSAACIHFCQSRPTESTAVTGCTVLGRTMRRRHRAQIRLDSPRRRDPGSRRYPSSTTPQPQTGTSCGRVCE